MIVWYLSLKTLCKALFACKALFVHYICMKYAIAFGDITPLKGPWDEVVSEPDTVF